MNPSLDNKLRQPERSMLEEAIVEYRSVLESEPQHFWTHLQLGRCYLSLGRAEEAVQALGACIALRPDAPWGYNAVASALVQLGRYDQAEAELRRLLQRHPDFLPARLHWGRTLQMRGKLPEARQQYDIVLHAPADQRLVVAAHYCAELDLQQTPPNETRALSQLAEVISQSPDFYPSYLLRSQLYFAQGQDVLAFQDLDRYLSLTSPRTGNPNAAIGRSQSRLGLRPDPVNPIDPVDVAEPVGTESQPTKMQTHHRRGRFLRLPHSRIPATAPARRAALAQYMLQEFQSALSQGGRSADLFDDLGAALELVGQPQEAIEAYTQGLELAPDNIKLRTKRAWARVAAGDIAAGAKDFQEVLQTEPRHAEGHSGLGYADAVQQLRADAEHEALEAAILGSGDYLVLHNVACIYAELSKSAGERQREFEDSALRMLRHAVQRWKLNGAGEPSELNLIEREPAFPVGLRQRQEFRELLTD